MEHRKTTKQTGIRRLFFIPTVIVLVIIFISVSFLFVKQYHNEYENNTLNNVKYIESDVDSWIISMKDILNVVSSFLNHTDDKEIIEKYFTSIEEGHERIMYIYFGSMIPYKDGGTFISSDQMQYDYDQTTRPWFKDALKTPGEVIITKPYVDAISSEQQNENFVIITFAKTIERDGKIIGVCAMDISIEDIADITKKYSEMYQSYISIVDNDGKYIMHENSSYVMNDEKNIFNIIPKKMKNDFFKSDAFFVYNKNDYYVSVPIKSTGWYIVDYGKKFYVIQKILRLVVILFVAVTVIFFGQFILVNKIVIPLSKILGQAAKNMKQMSEGHFNAEFDEKSKNRKDEAGLLVRSSYEMQKSLGETLYRIRKNSEDINSLMNNMNNGIDNLSHRTESQSVSLEEVASSIEEMSASIKQTAENAKIAGKTSSHVKETTHDGVNIVNETIENMHVIYDASKKISDITNVIDNIAFQTNILALNAAVEAARAGEQGRGFAVVASEVRNLAVNTSNSAKVITSLISDTVSKIEIGREASVKSGELLKKTEHLVNDVVEFLNDISSSIIQEDNGVDQINTAVMLLNKINQENVSLVNDSSNVSQNIFTKTESLLEEVSFFKFGDEQ